MTRQSLRIRREILRDYFASYLSSIFGGSPHYFHGRDPTEFWKFDDRFSYVPDEALFRRIVSDLGIGKGHRVVHPYAMDRQYADLLRRIGAVVEPYDLSVASAQRSGARLADAERLVDYVKRRADHWFAFEPTSLFRTVSSDPIRGILALASALNTADRVHVLFHQSTDDRYPPASDFMPFFHWLEKHFGARVAVRAYPANEGKLYAVTLSAPEDSRRKLMDFARLLHRYALSGFPSAYVDLRNHAASASERGSTKDSYLEFLRAHAERIIDHLSRTSKGRKALKLLEAL